MTHLRTTQNAPQLITPAIRSYMFVGARLPAALSDSNLFIILAVCAIGLLITLNIIFGFQGAVPSMEQTVISDSTMVYIGGTNGPTLATRFT